MHLVGGPLSAMPDTPQLPVSQGSGCVHSHPDCIAAPPRMGFGLHSCAVCEPSKLLPMLLHAPVRRLDTWFAARADENAADATGVTWPSKHITRLWKFFFKARGCCLEAVPLSLVMRVSWLGAACTNAQ